MEILQQILENSSLPALSAFILGLMTAISPCPLATNITAIGFIGRDIDNKFKVFINGAIYTLGRAVTYVSIGMAFYFGANQFAISNLTQKWGEKLLGPALIVIGLFMLGVLNIALPGIAQLTEKLGKKSQKNSWGVLLLGIAFALAFCPYSGVLFFGMLMPMTVASPGGLALPLIFALATGLPVLIIAWLLAYSVSSIGGFYNKVKTFEFWFRRIVAGVFIAAGIYYSYIYFL